MLICKKKIFLAVASLAITCSLTGAEVVLEGDAGETLTFEVPPEASFVNVLETIQQQMHALDDSDESIFEMTILDGERLVVSKSKGKSDKRDYFAPLTQSNIDDINFIVKTLATHSKIGLAGYESSLKKAGKNIDKVHPLRFLQCIFTSEELKGYASVIRGNGGYIWKKFLGGFVKTFKEEMKAGNVPENFILDFASQIKIDVNLIYPAYKAQNWDEFVGALISSVQPPQDSDRYKW